MKLRIISINIHNNQIYEVFTQHLDLFIYYIKQKSTYPIK